MKRASILVAVAILIGGCQGTSSSQPPGQSSAPDASQSQGPSPTQAPTRAPGSGGDAAVVDAANAITDWCTVMPADLVAQLVPGASAPQSQLFPPLKCTASNGVAVVEITYGGCFAPETNPGVPSISGLGEEAWLTDGYPVDDAYLTVVLGSDPCGTFNVEVAGHDGADHGDDAIAVARAVIAALH